MSPSPRKGSQGQHGPPGPMARMHGLWTSSSSFQQSTATPHRDESRKSSSLTGSSAPSLSLDSLKSLAAGRVYPMSSAVSLDSNTTSSNRSEGGDGFPTLRPRADSRPMLRQYSVSSAGKSSDYAERTSRDRYRTGKRASGAHGDANSVSKGPVKKAPSYIEDVEIQRRGGSRPPAQRRKGDLSKDSEKFSNDESEKSGSGANAHNLNVSRARSLRNVAADAESLMTARFKHVMIEGDHAVIVGRDGDTIQRCEDEPLHIPGAVQSFGVLLALQEEDDNKLTVRVVSENSERIIGYTPNQLFQLNNFCDILSEQHAYDLFENIDFIRDDDSDPAMDGPQIFTLVIRSPQRRPQKLWCAIHRNGMNEDLIICELELEDDPINPLAPPSASTSEPPEGGLPYNPIVEEYAEGTINFSKPLRVLRSARARKGEAVVMEVYSIMSQVQEQLAIAPNLDMLLKVLVGVVKELTGFNRIMIYQFDQAWNGKVVTELCDTWATKDLYKGLNFPASDIPAQARDLYRVNKVRLLYDCEQETSRLVCRTIEDLETPLDLTFSYLRAISPIHVKYLKNMAVRASMSISIGAFNELWGLIVCHSYLSKGMRVSFPIRKMCRVVGESASRNIERLSYASRLQARKLINTASKANNLSEYIFASSADLLSLFEANFGILSIEQATEMIGEVEKTQEALALLQYLRLRKITAVTHSTDIRTDFPDLIYAPGFTTIAGLLLVPLSVSGSDFIVFIRHEQIREVRWAGNPYDKSVRAGTDGYLEPRNSFAAWSEAVAGQCKEWTEEQIEITAVLCLVYGKFIEVRRQKEALLQKNNLTKRIISNAAHDVRTPLNAMINYLEIALEGNIDQEIRTYLYQSHSASKSLVSVINDLLDLTKAEEGHNLTMNEVFDFAEAVREEVNYFVGHAKRKGIGLELVENPGVPTFVIGDQGRVKKAISNVMANAIQNTFVGEVRLEICLVEHADDYVDIDVVIQDTGVGMSAKMMDSLFLDLEQVSFEDGDSLTHKSAIANDGMSEKSKTLGLGLAQVGRLVRNMNGQLRLNSEEGKGSRFVIRLRFKLPDINTYEYFNRGSFVEKKSLAPPIGEEGHVFVNILAEETGKMDSHYKSDESVDSSKDSFKSLKSVSSGKSYADRRIDVCQEPRRNAEIRQQDAGHPSSRTEKSLAMLKGLGRDSEPRPITSKGFAMPDGPYGPSKHAYSTDRSNANNLRILVAEDDSINRKIVQKRLEKLGHSVHLTINGEDCANAFRDRADLFDAVLMDIQMPIVDGLKSTKMIRSFEKTHPARGFSDRAGYNGRVPVFAVSASLVEKDRQLYVDGGFDGWILKPIDFKRLSTLLVGIVKEDIRSCCLYEHGAWERGGWFALHQPSVFSTVTAPSGQELNSKTPPRSFPMQAAPVG